MKHQLTATITCNGHTIVVGHNSSIKGHPFQERYRNKPEEKGQHAEINALVKYLRKDAAALARGGNRPAPLKYCLLQVSRTGADGKLRMAKPCQGCQRALRDYQLNWMYTDDKGEWRWGC